MLVRVFVDALSLLFRQRRSGFFIIAAAMTAAFVVFDFVAPMLGTGLFPAILKSLINLALVTVLAVAVHRLVLLDEGPGVRWGWRETGFAVRILGLAVAMVVLPMLGIAAATSLGFPNSGTPYEALRLLAVAGATYWLSQYFLILPAIAVDHSHTLKKSSVYTEENRVTTFIVVMIFPLIFSLIILPSLLFVAFDAFLVVLDFLSVIAMSMGVATLSCLYRELVPRSAWGRKGF